MRSFDFEKEYSKLLTPDIVSYIAQIHEYRGRYSADNVQKELLSELLEIARIQSTEASNRIEGIITTDDRLKKIVREKTLPKTRSEKEIAGYRDVLATIHENYEYMKVTEKIRCYKNNVRIPFYCTDEKASLKACAENEAIRRNI